MCVCVCMALQIKENTAGITFSSEVAAPMLGGLFMVPDPVEAKTGPAQPAATASGQQGQGPQQSAEVVSSDDDGATSDSSTLRSGVIEQVRTLACKHCVIMPQTGFVNRWFPQCPGITENGVRGNLLHGYLCVLQEACEAGPSKKPRLASPPGADAPRNKPRPTQSVVRAMREVSSSHCLYAACLFMRMAAYDDGYCHVLCPISIAKQA